MLFRTFRRLILLILVIGLFPTARSAFANTGFTNAYTTTFTGVIGCNWIDACPDGGSPDQPTIAPSGEQYYRMMNPLNHRFQMYLPAHTKIRLTLDLYIINTWQGDQENHPVKIDVIGKPAPIFDHTFSNDPTITQNYPVPSSPGRSGASAYGALQYTVDTTYHIEIIFDHSDILLALNFPRYQMFTNGFFGLDNVSVDYCNGCAAPTITQQPGPPSGILTFRPGQEYSATLQVVASGSDAFTYQWYRNGTLMPNAVSDSLGVFVGNAGIGSYHVVVHNDLGVVQSRTVAVQRSTTTCPCDPGPQ